MLTAARLHELLHYDQQTGMFTRLVSGPKTQRYVGKVAGRRHKVRGYREITVDGKLYYAQRLAWLYMTGEWPHGLVDHRDTDKDNNRWLNLRAADHVTNGQNRRGPQANSTTGVLGVSSNGSGFRARLGVRGREVHLGTFRTVAEAQAVRIAAKPQHHAF